MEEAAQKNSNRDETTDVNVQTVRIKSREEESEA